MPNIFEHKVNCPIDGVIFIQRHQRHKFCSRKCFLESRSLSDNSEKTSKKRKYPSYKCSHCGKHTELDFYPISQIKRWLQFQCPVCHLLPNQIDEDEPQLLKRFTSS